MTWSQTARDEIGALCVSSPAIFANDLPAKRTTLLVQSVVDKKKPVRVRHTSSNDARGRYKIFGSHHRVTKNEMRTFRL
jgi:hypothetical protein